MRDFIIFFGLYLVEVWSMAPFAPVLYSCTFPALWLLCPIVCTFFVLSHGMYPFFGVVDLVLLSVPLSYAISGCLVYFYACMVTQVDTTVVWYCITTFIILSTPSMIKMIPLYNTRSKLWKGELRNSKALFTVLFLNFLFLLFLFYFHYLKYLDGKGWMSGGTTWGDLPLHMSIINSFLKGENKHLPTFPTTIMSPIYAGVPLTISFIPHIHRASFIVTGMSMRQVFCLPNLLLLSSFIGLVFQFYQRVFHRRVCLSLLSLLFSVLSGGVGFLLWIGYYGFSLRTNIDLDFLERWQADESFPLPWWGIYGHILLPHIEASYAFPLTIGMWSLIYRSIDNPMRANGGAMQSALTAGICGLALSFYHTYLFYSAIMITTTLIVLSPRDMYNGKILGRWMLTLFPMLLGIPISFFFYTDGFYNGKFIFVCSYFWSFFQIVDVLFAPSTFVSLCYPLLFWLIALGAHIPLSIYGMFFLERPQFKFVAASWILFVVPNFFYFQPFQSHNLKFFCIWIFSSSISVTKAVHILWCDRKDLFSRVVIVLVCISLIASGSLAIRRDIKQYAVLTTEEDFKLSQWIDVNTKPSDIFLTSLVHSSPIFTLSGRSVYTSFEGWSMYHGYPNIGERLNWQYNILHANEDLNVLRELQSKNIAYVVIDPHLMESNAYNPNFWTSNFHKVFSTQTHHVFAVPPKRRKQ